MTKDTLPFDNDATKKLLGYDYQKLIALEYCLNAKSNQYIWIECFGDVATENESSEVKHHNEKHNLTSNSEDAWKTLKNFAVESDKIIDNDRLILFTTSSIKDDSIFFDWDKKNANSKYLALKKHMPAEGIKKFKEKFFELSKADSLKILGKFIIKSEQPKILDKWNELKEHPFFTIIPDNLKDSAIQTCYGYLTKKAIDNKNKWEININDFKEDLRFSLSKYTQKEIPFPISDKQELGGKLTERNFVFINKLKCLDIKEKDLANAVEDYLKANLSSHKLLQITPVIKDNLEFYDAEVKRSIEEEKNLKSYSINKEDLNTEKARLESIKIYYSSISKPHISIVGVSNTEKYYRNGRIHNITEETEFEWKFKEIDL